MQQLMNTATKTMTLKEITDLLEVRHNDAMTKVEKMMEEPEFGTTTEISYTLQMPNNASKQMNTTTKTMSSLEIAQLTGKNHADVLRDIRKVFEEAEIPASKFAGGYKDSNGQERPCYNLTQ